MDDLGGPPLFLETSIWLDGFLRIFRVVVIVVGEGGEARTERSKFQAQKCAFTIMAGQPNPPNVNPPRN